MPTAVSRRRTPSTLRGFATDPDIAGEEETGRYHAGLSRP